MTDDELLAAFSGKAPQASGPSGMSDADILAAFSNPRAKPIPQVNPQDTITHWQQLGAGFKQGLRDIGGSVVGMAEKVNQAVPALKAIDEFFGVEGNARQGLENYRQDTQAFQDQYGDSGYATAGRVGGNIVGTVPITVLPGAAVANTGRVGAFLTGAGGRTIANPLLRAGARTASLGTAGAGAGTTGNLLTQSGGPNSLADIAEEGAKTGAVMGVGVPAAFQGMRMVGRGLTGGGVNQETAQLAQRAIDQYGIPIRGGQISNSPMVRFTDSVLQRTPLSGYAGKQENAINAFTKAVSNSFGEDTPAITPKVMAQAKDRLGKEFDRISSGSKITYDQTLDNALMRVEQDASQVLADSEMKPIINQLMNIRGKVANGEIDGKTYQALVRKGSPLDRASRSPDSNVKYYAGEIRNALDDALSRSIAPDMVKDLQAARYQYKNMKTIEDLAEKSTDGRISPALLLNEVRKSFGDFAYGGGGDLGDLARIGQRFLKEPPSSGTSERLTVNALLGGAGGAAAMTDPMLAAKLLGAGVGAAGIARLAGMTIDNPLYRRMLLNAARNNNALIRLPGNVTPAIPAGVAAYEQTLGAP